MTNEQVSLHICRGPHHSPELTDEQREIVASEWNRGEALVAAMLASSFIERNRNPEPPLCTRPDCREGVIEVRDSFGDLWLRSCPMCRTNETWHAKYGY